MELLPGNLNQDNDKNNNHRCCSNTELVSMDQYPWTRNKDCDHVYLVDIVQLVNEVSIEAMI